MNPEATSDFANRYAAAWSSQNAAEVAGFFDEGGFLRINAGPPSSGRAAIATTAQSFMTAFPDLKVFCDRITHEGDKTLFHWTLEGTNTGPGGTGRRVRISGFEAWQFSSNGLIAESEGTFDEAHYQQQLHG
ncbi:MAG: ester cyclase [Bryobacter sp.]|nr:ester cyclase [Bryobacter sp.]